MAYAPGEKRSTSRAVGVGNSPVKSELLRFLSCPACGASVEVATGTPSDSDLGCSSCGRTWAVRDGVPDFTFPDELRKEDSESRTLWDRIARFYGAINGLTGLMRGVSTSEERRELIAGLGLTPGGAVLEVATGTGRNLEYLAAEVGDDGFVFGTDLSPRMLGHARRRADALGSRIQLAVGNSQHLPHPDGAFDAVLDGAGIKYYPDKAKAMREMLRVVRPGGKVLITELGMPSGVQPTLRQRLLRLWIPGFGEGPPMDAIPEEAVDVQLTWDPPKTYFALEFRRPEEGEAKP